MAAANPLGNPRPEKIKNIIWLETLNFTILHDLPKIKRKENLYTAPRMINFLGQNFEFHLLQVTKDELAVYVIRIDTDPDVEPDSGYFLQFQISFIGLDEPAKFTTMGCGEDIARVLFLKRSFRKAAESYKDKSYIFDLKIVINIVECENLNNIEREQAESVLRTAKETSLSQEVAVYLALLLKRPGLEDVFTGRLGPVFTSAKLNLILRTSTYAEEILLYLLAKREGQEILPYINYSEILNYILKCDRNPISDYDTLLLYLIAHRTGLDYLTELVVDYMMTKMHDPYFVIDMLQVSDHVEDQRLFERTTVCFLDFYQDIKRTPIFKKIVDNTGWVARSIIYSCTRFMKKKSTWIPGWNVNRNF